MGPIDYTTQVQQPFQTAAQGYQVGAMMRNDQQQQAEHQYQLDQRAKAQEAAQAMQRDLYAVSTNPNATGREYAGLMTRYPQLAENLKRGWDTLNAEQQQNSLNDAAQAFAALQSGRPDLAFDALNQQAAARLNSGDEKGAQLLTGMARAIQANPQGMKAAIGLRLAAIPGGDKVLAGMHTLGEEQRADQLQPYKVQQDAANAAKTTAEANKTGMEAAFLPAVTEANLGKTRAETSKTYADIENQRAQQQIAALNVQISQANSETQRGELILKRQEMEQKLNQAQAEKTNTGQDTLDTLTQGLSTVNAVMKHPGLSKGTGLGGGFMAWFNGTDAADFRAQLSVLKSQSFLSSVAGMKGTGALSDAEGKRLESAVAALDTSQSADQFRSQLDIIKATLEKAQAKVISRSQAPTAGGPVTLSNPVTRQHITEGDINALMKRNPGATREQVLNFLQSKGFK